MTVALLLALSLAVGCGSGDSSPIGTPSPTKTTIPPSPSPNSETFTEPPERDLLDLARRFRGYPYGGPAVARTEPYNHSIGDQAEFTLTDLVETSEYTISASVRAITDHAYFFVEDEANYDQSSLDQIAEDFESSVWPDITAAFGEPPTPGVDADPRITILHADLRGAGGYVSGSNQYPAAAVPRSAEREILYIDESALGSPGPSYNSLVAHELQHLINLNRDPNEESWVNEGLSEVAWQIVGGGTDGVLEFLDKPDTQLNFWPYLDDVGVHYSASELFFTYLLDQYGGRENASALTAERANGIAGVAKYLEGFSRAFDGATDRTFNNVFADFVVANAIDLSTGRHSHSGFDGTTSAITHIATGSEGNDTVHQYGTDYYRVESGLVFDFDGADTVSIGIPDLDGPFWWSDRSDGIDSRLTRKVDLSGVSSATLTFDIWHDIEPGWDYGYVAVSTDDGRTWTALRGDNTTQDDPVGAAYGPGYTGKTDGWVRETVDLSAYAGDEILLRFEYITDDATHLTGMAVDNIGIAEIGLEDSADSDTGWNHEGFRRTDGLMQQEFIVQAIDPGGRIFRDTLDSENVGSLLLADGAVIAISAVTPSTTERASYSWSLTQ